MVNGNWVDPFEMHIDYATASPGTPDWSVNVYDYEFNGTLSSGIYMMKEKWDIEKYLIS